MSKRKKNQQPKCVRSKKSNSDQEASVLSVSQFVRDFVRRHVAPSQRATSDLSWSPGCNKVSFSLNLRAQSTRINRPDRKKSTSSDLPIRFKHSKQRSITQIACPKPYKVPSNLPNQLHNLWIGYAGSAVAWSRLECMSSFQPVASTSQTSQLESILRMNLIGSKLKVVRCTTSCLAGKQGIVLMETKTLFRMAFDLEERTADVKDTETILCNVPKAGSLFLLFPPQCLRNKNQWNPEQFGVLLNGDRLMQRVVDRAIRKWRAPVPTMGQSVLSVDELMGELLCEQCC